jgi:hypothetical protein
MAGAVVLHKEKDLGSVVDGPAGREELTWGDVGTVHFLPGDSTITSVGQGTVVCFFIFYGA